MFDVNFDSSDPLILCHPDFDYLKKDLLQKLLPYELKHHFILFSSGTSGGDLKGYALSKEALFKNAQAVNSFFNLNHNDTWGLSLPIYHVGGLSVLCRAHLLQNKIIDLRKWDPRSWHAQLKDVSVTSVVPTQLYDLIKLNLKAPENLRYLIVGGDYLSSKLKERAMELGWPVIRTFGMSEVSSQLASASSPVSDELEILPIHEVKLNGQRLLVKSPSLFTLEFTMGEAFKATSIHDLSTHDGFYMTKDSAEISGNIIHPLGRMGEEFKVAGHLVNMNKLRDTLSGYLLEKDLFGQMEFQIESDERKGHKLILLKLNDFIHEIQDISQLIAPVKIDETRKMSHFNRTALGKLKK
jgi:O-succinylbenzoic acid--CoA ligase